VLHVLPLENNVGLGKELAEGVKASLCFIHKTSLKAVVSKTTFSCLHSN